MDRELLRLLVGVQPALKEARHPVSSQDRGMAENASLSLLVAGLPGFRLQGLGGRVYYILLLKR